MSECNIFEKKLPAYVEGVLPEVEDREMMEHLESCGRCRAVLEDLKKTGDLLAGLEEKEPPPWFRQRVMARIREEAGEKKRLLRKLFYPLHIKIPIEAVASLMVAMLAWYVYQEAPREMKAPTPVPQSEAIRSMPLAPEPAETGKDLPVPAAPVPAEKKRVDQTPEPAPKGQVEIRGGRVQEEKLQERMLSAASPTPAPTAEEKKGVTVEEEETARPAMAPLKKSEPFEIKPAPAPPPALQAAPRRMGRELREKDEGGKQKSEALQDRTRVAGQAAKGRPQSVWTVRVRDPEGALEKIRKWLQGAGAEHIREEGDADRRVISGRVGVGELDGLADRLKALGEVSLQEHPGLAAGETGFIIIEIILVLP
jgi:hypothetical protein